MNAFKDVAPPQVDGFVNFSDESEFGHSEDDFIAIGDDIKQTKSKNSPVFAPGQSEIITIHDPDFVFFKDYLLHQRPLAESQNKDYEYIVLRLTVQSPSREF